MFQIGDRVKRVAFTDCSGVFHPEINNLTVIEEHTEEPYSPAAGLPAYQRITAVRGFASCEGAAHLFFEKEEPDAA